MLDRVAALAAALGFCMCTAAFAEALETGVDAQFGALLGHERSALEALREGHAERILRGSEEDEAARYDVNYLQQLPAPDSTEELTCLAYALYFEARGESVEGQYAVAEVILNRVDSPSYPDTICGVVYQGTGQSYACQFSFTCDGNSKSVGEQRAFALALRIAWLMKNGAARELTDGATHFHTTAVNPSWSGAFPQTAQIGRHVFYRQPVRMSAN